MRFINSKMYYILVRRLALGNCIRYTYVFPKLDVVDWGFLVPPSLFPQRVFFIAPYMSFG